MVSDALFIIGLGLLFPLVHLGNQWFFSFAEFAPNVGLIYLPAFLRLLNVLVLGKFKGTVATLLGVWVLLLANQSDPLLLKIVNMLCSCAGPVLALLWFEHWRQRPVNLRSLTDLTQVTVVYCFANSLAHHFAWALAYPERLGTPQQMLIMVIGDLVGALLGAYVLKWSAERMGLGHTRQP